MFQCHIKISCHDWCYVATDIALFARYFYRQECLSMSRLFAKHTHNMRRWCIVLGGKYLVIASVLYDIFMQNWNIEKQNEECACESEKRAKCFFCIEFFFLLFCIRHFLGSFKTICVQKTNFDYRLSQDVYIHT